MSPLLYQWSYGGTPNEGVTIQLRLAALLYVMNDKREQDMAQSGEVLIEGWSPTLGRIPPT